MFIRSASTRHNLPLKRLGLRPLQHAYTSPRCAAPICSSPRFGGANRRFLTTGHELRPWRRTWRTGIGFLPGRSLATAIDDFIPLEDVPFERLSSSPPPLYSPPQVSGPRLYDLKPFDPSSPLVMREPPPRPARQRINPSGIPGDVEEMVHVIEACLQVGKLDRAALVLKRLSGMNVVDGLHMITLHNKFLQESLDRILASPSLGKAEELHRWYELHIRSAHLPQTAATIAYMLKASLLTTHGSRLDRLVTRYMGMVPGEAGLDVLYMTNILSDQDRATITEICPTYNLSPDDFEVLSEGLDSPMQQGSDIEGSRLETRAIPEVLSTPQKGMGLRMLKQTLTLFSEIPEGRDISKLTIAERREIQSRLERDCVDAAVNRWREENQALLKMGLNTSLSTASLNSRLYEWQVALEARLRQELQMVEASEAAEHKNKEDLDRCMYGPFLRQSSPSRLAAVTILSTLSSLAMNGADAGVPINAMINALSRVAEEDIRAQIRSKDLPSKFRDKVAKAVGKKALRIATGQKQTEAVASASLETNPSEITNADFYADKSWPLTIRTKVGAALLSALIETAKVNVVKEHPETRDLISQLQPAFTHANQFKKGKKVGMILPNRMLVDLMKREPRGDFLARHLPMVVAPEPWSKFDKGGFLEYPAPLVRVKHGEKDQRLYTEAAIARGDMDQVLKGLDVLGRTAWKINKPVFDVMLEAWNSGEEVANIPPLNPNIPTPTEPESSDDPMQRRMWIKAVKLAENEKSGLHSVRCFMNFQLEIARAFRDQTFYFPHNIDFRGRAYPIPTYLNHMGADHVRGLMAFAQKKELGENGLRWLKVHLANVFGFDKASLRDRESFAMENLTNIFDSANNPLSGSRWWLKAEDPWQCLATCFELKAALESPEPTKYMSQLPVHQDGTCNGLQHYAALGGDTWGARQVNLEPGEKPADVYTAVANLVKESIAEDIKQDNPFAKALDGKITRKVVKQTVMTNVYGVTFAGAKKQVLKQLDALYPNIQARSGYDPNLLASYIATKIFKALSTMFRGAHDIQYWLGEIGGRVCRALTAEQIEQVELGLSPDAKKPSKKTKSGNAKTSTDELLSQFRSTLVWTTPLRMPVVQPYRKSGTRVIQTCLQDLVLAAPERSDPVHRRKQLQAFPPNFIHSLDASHMILSALECEELGLDFAAVHDSFWTHAADVDKMNRVLRDAFIRIHSEDVIGRLASEFEARYKGSIYLAKVTRGTAVADKVLALRKKQFMSLKDELLMEKKRLDLLQSSDPDKVAEGKKMVTPASIFDEMSAAEANVIESEDMEDFGLGKIPTSEKASTDALEAKVADETTAEAAEEQDTDQPFGVTDERMQSLLGTGHFQIKLSGGTKQRKATEKSIQIWLPLAFPAIPEKGDFDVRRLRTSEYFFS